jgi:hypothetical protein
MGLSLTAVLRTITELIGLDSVYGVSFPHVVARHPSVLADVWAGWDTGYYLTIAQRGYPVAHAVGHHTPSIPKFVAFAPLYPALIAVLHWATSVGWIASGQVVSGLATVIGLAGLVHLVDRGDGPTRSSTAAMLIVAFPTGFFLLVDYPESLALALAVWAFIAVRNRWWLTAGVLVAGAAMTKYYLALLIVPLLMEVASNRPGDPESAAGRWRNGLNVAAIIGPTVAAFVTWMAVCAHLYGDALAFVHVQSEWNRRFAFPWNLASTTAGDLFHLRFLDTSVASVAELFDAVTVVLLGVLAIVVFFKVRRSYGVFLGLAWCTFAFQTVLYSETREVLVLFPFFIGLARWVDGHPWRERLVLTCFLPSTYFLVGRFVTNRFAG